MSDIRIEYPSAGSTYSRDVFGVYAYDTFPASSVLAGQQRRSFLDSFDTLDEAQAEYPDAVSDCACGWQAPDLSHLPFDPDYDED